MYLANWSLLQYLQIFTRYHILCLLSPTHPTTQDRNERLHSNEKFRLRLDDILFLVVNYSQLRVSTPSPFVFPYQQHPTTINMRSPL